jgi:hypothetical protein
MDDNAFNDIYLRNVATGKTKLLTKDTSGEPSDEDSSYTAISPNGRLVGFYSYAADLIANDPPSDYSAYVLDRKSGKIKLVDRKTSGAPGTERSYVIGISNSFVLFSSSSALVGGDNNDLDDVYRRGPLT